MEKSIQECNVADHYKNDRLVKWTTELIREDLQNKAFPYAMCVENWQGDFNLSSCLRSTNAFNGKEFFFLGKRDWDRRGAVGTQHYTKVKRLKTREELINLKEQYTLVALENTTPNTVPLDSFEWPNNSLIILGEEGIGITDETLSLCDYCVFIPQFGSVRSLNAAVAGSIAAYDFVTKYNKKCKA